MAAGPDFDDAFRAKLRDLFLWRRDVRHFRTDPIPPAVVEALIEVACLAPSVGLSEPWRFVLVDDPRRRAEVIRNFETANADALAATEGDRAALYASLKLAGLAEAPVHLAAFVDEGTLQGAGLGRRTMPEMLRFSVVTAVHTLWLAARALGIGVGWVSILDPVAVAKTLDVPAEWDLVAYLCLGYPVAEAAVPELETRGWESRAGATDRLFRR